MIEQLHFAFIISKREIRDQFRDWRIIFPIIGLTVFFPFLMNFTTAQVLQFVNRYGATIVGERLVPFSMMIVGFFPISVSLVIALESFVGEKQRGSIEPLLNTPLLDWQIYIGKLISSIVPPLIASFTGMTVYCLGLIINNVPLPELQLVVQIVILTIIQAIVMVTGAVVVSSQATSVKAANLLASFIIIPMALLIQGESIVMFWGNYATLWWVVFGLVVLAVLLLRIGLAHFSREELLGREIDVLNFKWGWKLFKSEFVGNATNIWNWYRMEIFGTLRGLRFSLLIMLLVVVASVFIGVNQSFKFSLPLEQLGVENAQDLINNLRLISTNDNISPVFLIVRQNLRVIFLSFVLGVISLGIFGVLPLIASIGVAGYLMAVLNQVGINSLTYFAGFILPHGILEIFAVIVSTAAIFQMGVVLALPDQSKTIGEVWILSISSWVKLLLGIVIPLIIVAAFIEAWITPHVAIWLLN
jgi:uncharacterized membrane protein SpoIIM required for sporulation